MSAIRHPKRLHYGWVLTAAFTLLVAAGWLLLLQSGAGVAHASMISVDHLLTIVLSAWGGLLALWLLLIEIVFSFARSWRGRTFVALLPACLAFGLSVWSFALHLPSPQKYFSRMFNASLPSMARDVQFAPSCWTGSDQRAQVTCHFGCSPNDILELIKAMGLTPAKSDYPEIQRFVSTDSAGIGYRLEMSLRTERVELMRGHSLADLQKE